MMDIRLLRRTTVETVVLISKGNISSQNVRVEFSLEDMDMSRFQQGGCIRADPGVGEGEVWVHVTHLNIAKTRRRKRQSGSV
jgi:hypothetical protein